MATQNQITGGAFQDIAGNPLAEGYLILSLSQDAQVNSQEIAAGSQIKVSLDGSGNVVTDPAVNIWPNDVLSPANTFYNVSAYTAEGQLVWGPNAQQVLSAPSPFVIGAWIPGAVNVLNPGGNITGLIEAGANVTITGSGTGTSPYSIASSGGGGGGVTSFEDRTGAVTLESSDVTTALTYTPVNKAGDTMTGLLVLSANPTANLGAATKQYVDSSSGTAITALTGDVTATGPGSSAASVVKVNGAAVPASSAYVGTNSSHQIVAATTPLLPANNLSDVATAATARTNLGLGTMATENSSSVAITGGAVNGTTLGATTASTAKVTTLAVGSSQAVSGVQGSTGTNLAAATGSFTSGHLTATDANGNLVDSGVAKPSSAFGTMATQNATSVAVTGGTIDGTTVGSTTPAAGSFTSGAFSGTVTAPTIDSLGAINSNASVSSSVQLTVGNTGQQGRIEYIQNGNNSFFGMYSTNSGSWVGISPSVPGPSGTLALGGYYNGLGFGGKSAGTGTPIFGVCNSSQGSTPVSFYVLDNNKVFTFNNTLDDGSGNMTLTGTLKAAELATTQTPTASATASDHSIPIVVNGTTYYIRLSSTP